LIKIGCILPLLRVKIGFCSETNSYLRLFKGMMSNKEKMFVLNLTIVRGDDNIILARSEGSCGKDLDKTEQQD